jgi:hypothetical protein
VAFTGGGAPHAPPKCDCSLLRGGGSYGASQRATLEVMQILKILFCGVDLGHTGEHHQLELAAPRFAKHNTLHPRFTSVG